MLLSCVVAFGTAQAAAPAVKTPAGPPAETSRQTHLDLRPPTTGDDAGIKALAGEPRRGAFVRDDGYTGDSDHRHALIALPEAARQPAIVGRAEAMAQRFRHEGLPVARLWENHAAFVSIGLNGRGKPGIWLVQKVH